MNEEELGQIADESLNEGDLDEATMQLIAQLLQEGYTEDEIVEAILSAEDGGEEEEPVPKGDMEFLGEMDKLKNFGGGGDDDDDEEEPEEFAAGGFAGSEPPPAAAAAPAAASEKKEPPKKEPPKKTDDKPKKDKELSDVRLKKPVNHLAATIGRLGRFN
jgi:pyruvate/2-oxoglutarate dehydrogenase complex dihydrolipoamide acyltransferase (E2) component